MRPVRKGFNQGDTRRRVVRGWSWESGGSVTCSMSAASLRRWAMSSDSVSRSLRRPDLYSWPTSSLWRLSFTWLTRKCITAFGTLRRGGEKKTEQMVENKDARWPRRLCCYPDGGGGLVSDPPGGRASAQVPLRCKL